MSDTRKETMRRRKALADALAGVIASLVSLLAFYPLDVIKTNAQAGGRRPTGTLYRGVGIKTLHTVSSNFCYFYIYSWILSFRKRERPSTLTRLALSAIAAMLNTCLTLPLDVLSTKMQTQQEEASQKMDQVWNEVKENHVSCHTEDEKKDETAPSEQIMHQAVVPETRPDQEHWTVLWKGLGPSLLLCSNPSIHYTAFDVIKSRILERSGKRGLSMLEAFVVGLLAKFVATVATYPLIRTKIMLMVTSEASMLQCLTQEFQQNGIKGCYRGCHLQLFHTVLKSALLMMVRERITDMTHRLLASAETS